MPCAQIRVPSRLEWRGVGSHSVSLIYSNKTWRDFYRSPSRTNEKNFMEKRRKLLLFLALLCAIWLNLHDSAITRKSSGVAPHRQGRGTNDIPVRTADLPPSEQSRTENCSNKVVCLIHNIELSDDEYADAASLDFLPMGSSPLEHRKFIEKLMAIPPLLTQLFAAAGNWQIADLFPFQWRAKKWTSCCSFEAKFRRSKCWKMLLLPRRNR